MTVENVDFDPQVEATRRHYDAMEAHIMGYLVNKDWAEVLPTRDRQQFADFCIHQSITSARLTVLNRTMSYPTPEQVHNVLSEAFDIVQAEYARNSEDSPLRMIAENPFTLENIQEIIQ